jgi:hypothetical protein
MKPPLLKGITGSLLSVLFFSTMLNAQQALTNEGSSIYLESGATLSVKGNLENKSAGSFTNNGIIAISGDLIQNSSSSLNAVSSGVFRFDGNGLQLISGSGTLNFYDLTLAKSAGECQLQTGISLSRYLTFSGGNIFLNNRQIDLLSSGELVGETNSSRVYDNASNTGTITATRVLNAPSSVNPGNLGAIITSAQNLGSTTVTRGHQQQLIVSDYSITRYYDIVPTTNTGLNATLRLHYFTNELNGQVEADLVQWHSPDNGITWNKRGGTLNMSEGYVQQTGYNAFQRHSLISSQIASLPLTLIKFTANKTATGQVDLFWTTTDEINSSHFDIERSVNGRQWIKIGVTQASGGQGYTHNYFFKDQHPNDANYYRLRIADLDETFEYSPVRFVGFGASAFVRMYPTLTRAGSICFIEGVSPEKAMLELYDISGKLISRSLLTNNFFTWPAVPAGTYVVRVSEKNSNTLLLNQQVIIY